MKENLSSIKEFVDEIYAEYPDNIAYKFIVDGNVESRTYKNLRNDVYGMASYLVGKKYYGTHIALLGGTSYEWVVSFLAIIISGNVGREVRGEPFNVLFKN